MTNTTNTTKKMTKRDYFAQIKANYALTEDEVAFIDHEIELLSRSKGGERKPSARQIENASLKEQIVASMEPNTLYTVTDMLKNFEVCAEMSSQKVSALISQLVAENAVVKTVDKRKAYFSLA